MTHYNKRVIFQFSKLPKKQYFLRVTKAHSRPSVIYAEIRLLKMAYVDFKKMLVFSKQNLSRLLEFRESTVLNRTYKIYTSTPLLRLKNWVAEQMCLLKIDQINIRNLLSSFKLKSSLLFLCYHSVHWITNVDLSEFQWDK